MPGKAGGAHRGRPPLAAIAAPPGGMGGPLAGACRQLCCGPAWAHPASWRLAFAANGRGAGKGLRAAGGAAPGVRGGVAGRWPPGRRRLAPVPGGPAPQAGPACRARHPDRAAKRAATRTAVGCACLAPPVLRRARPHAAAAARPVPGQRQAVARITGRLLAAPATPGGAPCPDGGIGRPPAGARQVSGKLLAGHGPGWPPPAEGPGSRTPGPCGRPPAWGPGRWRQQAAKRLSAAVSGHQWPSAVHRLPHGVLHGLHPVVRGAGGHAVGHGLLGHRHGHGGR